MAVATGEILQCTYRYIYRGMMAENIIHMRWRGLPGTQEENEGAVLQFWELLKPVISNGVTLQDVVYKTMTPVALDQQFATPPDGTQIGGRSGEAVASTLAAVVTLRTGTAGKSHRGRMYIPWVGASYANGSEDDWSTLGFGAITSVCNDILAEFGDATGTNEFLALGIYSKLIGGTDPYTLAGWQAVSQLVPRKVFGNQRRRRPGIGV